MYGKLKTHSLVPADYGLWFMVYGLRVQGFETHSLVPAVYGLGFRFEGSGFRNALSGPSGWPRKTYRSLASLTAEQ